MENCKNELITQARQTCNDLLTTLERFTPDEFNRTPPQNGWTAGQIAEHLLLSAGAVEVIAGNTQPAPRPADQKVDTIAAIFLDFGVKFQSAENIMPTACVYDQQTLIDGLKTAWSKLKEAVRLLDLSVLCLDVEVPGGLGHLTRLEWIWLYVYHTQRHLRQLDQLLIPEPNHHRLPLPGR